MSDPIYDELRAYAANKVADRVTNGAQILEWKSVDDHSSCEEAWLGTPEDGVRFTLSHYPTCYRRGPHRLLIEVMGGPRHNLWGCFDSADQPMRYYHLLSAAMAEAECVAIILMLDRQKSSPPVGAPFTEAEARGDRDHSEQLDIDAEERVRFLRRAYDVAIQLEADPHRRQTLDNLRQAMEVACPPK